MMNPYVTPISRSNDCKDHRRLHVDIWAKDPNPAYPKRSTVWRADEKVARSTDTRLWKCCRLYLAEGVINI
jgi:hypothetical protein